MARMATRPGQVRVQYRGLPYMLNLLRCRRALVERQVEGGLDSMECLAEAVGISRSTASRFFSGRPTSLTVTLRILAALKLRFEDVATLEEGSDEPEGPAGAASEVVPSPRQPPSGAMLRLSGGFAG